MASKDKKANGAAKTGAGNTAGTDASGKPLPLFYKNPMPLDARTHAKLGLKNAFGFGYTQGINAVPVNLIEMPQICHFYPIAFSPDANATPVAILGLRNSENLFLQRDGLWESATYIPAYVRRYPFIFSEIPGSDQLTLCVDNNPEILEDGGAQRFFGEDGKPTALANNALEFCKSYHAAAHQTIEFSKALVEKNLLVSREAQINVAGDKRINFSGFRIVDEAKLAALSDKDFLDLRAKGWLPFIYAHLFSSAQWQRLSHMLNLRLEKEAA